MDGTLVVLLTFSGALAGASWVLFIWTLVSGLRLRRQGDPAGEEVLAAAGWPFALAILSTLVALPLAANWLGETGASWAVPGQVLINLVVQPVCLYLVVAGAYKLALGLVGRPTYAFRYVPREQAETPGDSWGMALYCAAQGTVAVAVFGWLGWYCLSPLL